MEAGGNKDDKLDGDNELPTLAKRSLPFTDMEEKFEKEKSPLCSSNLEPEGNKEDKFDGVNNEKEVPISHKQCVGETESESEILKMTEELGSEPKSNLHGVDDAVPGSEPKLRIKHKGKKKTTPIPVRSPNSIVGRLRKRPNIS